MKCPNLVSAILILQCAVTCKAGTLTLSNGKISIKGKAQMKFAAREKMWASLSAEHRFPLIYSGDLIALRLATTSGIPKWLGCSKTADCTVSTCPGADVMVAAKWSACPTVVFGIRARGKADGQTVDSGDHVRITFPHLDEMRHFYCSTLPQGKCTANWKIFPWTGNKWRSHTRATFRIFSKNGMDGTPLQLGDVVGLKYPYGSNSAWLQHAQGFFYSRPCSTTSKKSCAKENAPTGFQIFNKLPEEKL